MSYKKWVQTIKYSKTYVYLRCLCWILGFSPFHVMVSVRWLPIPYYVHSQLHHTILELIWLSYSLVNSRILCLLNGHILPPPNCVDYWASNGYHILSKWSKHVSFLYMFLKPHQTAYHSNVSVRIRQLRYIYLRDQRSSYNMRCKGPLGIKWKLHVLIRHLYLRGIWFDVQKTDNTINICLKEIGLHAQIWLNSQHNWETYMTFQWAWESSLWVFFLQFKKDLQKLWEKSYDLEFGFANHLILITWFVS